MEGYDVKNELKTAHNGIPRDPGNDVYIDRITDELQTDHPYLSTDPEYEISINKMKLQLMNDPKGTSSDPEYEISIDNIMNELKTNQNLETGFINTDYVLTPGDPGYEAHIHVVSEPNVNTFKAWPTETKSAHRQRPPPPPTPMPVTPLDEGRQTLSPSIVRQVSQKPPALPARNPPKGKQLRGDEEYDTLEEYQTISYDIDREMHLAVPPQPMKTTSPEATDDHVRSRRLVWATAVILLVMCLVVVVVVPSVVLTRNKHNTPGIDGCASSPCMNQGTCVATPGSYSCYCPFYFTGVRCETGVHGPWIYFNENGNPGYISSLSLSTGVQTRISQSGGGYEYGLAADTNSSLIFYTMSSPNSVWRANLTDISNTKIKIFEAQQVSYSPRSLALSTVDQLVFIDQDYYGVTMMTYQGTNVQTLNVPNKKGSFGLAVDQSVRVLFFTDEQWNTGNANVWKASYSSSGWLGSAKVLLSGIGTGQVGNNPEGLVLEAGTLYWILQNSAEIRSMSTSGSSSVTVIPGGPSGVNSVGLAKRGSMFYYTSFTSTGGVWQVTLGGTRTRISPNATLLTTGITIV